MKTQLKRLSLAFVNAAMISIAGCGGGGSGSGSGSGSGGDDAITLSGVAATGAAFVGATVEAANSSGTVGTSDPVGISGKFSFKLVKGANPPFVLKASRTTADGAVESLVSVYAGSGLSALANITPITNLIASRLSPSGDPLKLAAELAANSATLTTDTIAAKVLEVQTILAPILTATETSASNPLTSDFPVDGTGYDRLLDSIKVTITPSSDTTTNIDIGIKQTLASNAAPTTIHFTSTATGATIPGMPAIDPSTLVESGTAVRIANLLADLTICYGIPFADRVNGVTGSVTVVAGSAADVKAPQCKAVFWGGDPANFLSNGYRVGRNAGNVGAFSSLFRAGATGVVFSQGSYEFTRANGDIVIGFKSMDVAGNEGFDTLVVRKDLADLKLKLIGNQHAYSGGVVAYQQLRQFPTLGQSAFNYYSTGYTVNVDHITGGTGVDGSIFDRVVVTTPKNTTLVLKPKSGSSYLVLVKNPGVGETLTGTSFVRLNSVYADTSNTADPSVKDPSLVFADRTEFNDAYIATIPAQGVWKFEYFRAGNTGATPDVTQNYRTRARAMTTAELRLRGLAMLAPTPLASLQSYADATFGTVSIANDVNIRSDWVVPVGALPPTSLSVYGQYGTANPKAFFNDSASVGSTARTGTIFCSASGVSDTHCSGASGSPYASTAFLTGLHLWARDPVGREFASFYALYKLN